jgi:alpha-tubulin suppressor-like RCC1 family protein
VAILVHDGASELCGWGNNDTALFPGPRGIVEQPACDAMIWNIRQLSAGERHVCARQGGMVYSCWGTNADGQLGNGDDLAKDEPAPGRMTILHVEIVAIAAGAYHACALLKTGAVMCWGRSRAGETGIESAAPVSIPTPVPGVRARAVVIGSGAGSRHTCVALDDGRLQCWGSDSDGQLGSGATQQDALRFSAAPVTVRF